MKRMIDSIRKAIQRALFPGMRRVVRVNQRETSLLRSQLNSVARRLDPLEAANKMLMERVDALKADNKRLSRTVQKSSDHLTAVIDLLAPIYLQGSDADLSGMTPQERAWFGKHGFRYIVHHMGEDWEKTRVPFWSQALSIVPQVSSLCEFGANIGANLKAIRFIRPDIELAGVEVNPVACSLLRQGGFNVTQGSAANVDLGRTFDLVFSRGVLIHVKPSELSAVMLRMANHASRYVLIFEHYSETMHSLDTYGRAVAKTTGEESEGYQFWGDFSGEFAKLFPDWSVVRSGVQTTVDLRPKHGDLHWTIFRRPDTHLTASR